MKDFYANKSGVSSIADHASERYADIAVIGMITKTADLLMNMREIKPSVNNDNKKGQVDIEMHPM